MKGSKKIIKEYIDVDSGDNTAIVPLNWISEKCHNTPTYDFLKISKKISKKCLIFAVCPLLKSDPYYRLERVSRFSGLGQFKKGRRSHPNDFRTLRCSHRSLFHEIIISLNFFDILENRAEFRMAELPEPEQRGPEPE